MQTIRRRLSAALQSPEGILLARLALVAAVYTAVRLVFYIEHRASFAKAAGSDVAMAFVHGLRFDASAIAYSNIPFILLSLVPASLLARQWYQRSLKALFVAVNGAATVINMGDVGYYPFTGTRVTMDVWALSGEATAQADQLFLNFAGLTALGLGLLVALVLFYPQQRSEMAAPMPRRLLRSAAAVVAVLALTVLAARGGAQKKPLNPIHAFQSGSHEVGILTLNSAFTMLQSPRQRQLAPVQHFASDAAVDSLLATSYGFAERMQASPLPQAQNVVLLILESFGTEFWGGDDREAPELTPFLDSLSRHGAFYTQSFANGRRSMDALPSILLGVPLYMGRSIAVSEYQGNQWLGLGHFLEEAGYHTSFFHGAPKGTMYFDAIAAMSGVRDFYPLERFPEDVRDDAFDGHWGLYDEEALQFAVRQVGTFQEPWFATMFTISTHHPYRVPPQYAASLPAGSREIHQSVAYVDLAVRRFFEAARTQPWFENTLFVITGDHTPPLRSARYDTPLGRYMVPTLLYHPAGRLPALETDRVTQHVDLFPTILDYAGVRPERVPRFGRSLFSSQPGEAVLTTDQTYWIVRPEGVLERMPSGSQRVLAYRGEHTGDEAADLPDALEEELGLRLLAYVQHYANSLINNSFYRAPR
ncbi:MAG: LTA synthase family protein [Gemmatimonadaceae bacterium]|nr:LTA synthase family protein [Gemmatimonadaceae bacterium]MCW5827419.1 LTA synthase family protein [Gemmatimonadaceae bacterium]